MFLFDRECIEGVKEENSKKIFYMGEELFSEGDYQEAIEYYRLSAAMGNVDAIYKLGLCYLDGKGSRRDFSIARAYFKLGVTKGNLSCLYRLGDLYMEGLGVERDERKAVEYYVESYNNLKNSSEDVEKYPELLYRIAKVFMEGKLLEQNLRLANQFFCVALEEFRTRVEANGDSESYQYIKSIKKCLRELKKARNEDDVRTARYEEEEDEEPIYENDYFDDEPNRKYIDNDFEDDDDDEPLNINYFGKGSFN